MQSAVGVIAMSNVQGGSPPNGGSNNPGSGGTNNPKPGRPRTQPDSKDQGSGSQHQRGSPGGSKEQDQRRGSGNFANDRERAKETRQKGGEDSQDDR